MPSGTFDFSRVAAVLEGFGATLSDEIERPGATPQDIATWDSEHAPCSLPPDLRSFLLVSNGFLMRWRVKAQGKETPLGCMQINPLGELKSVPNRSWPDSDTEEEGDEDEGVCSLPRDARAFRLDSTCTAGTVALVFQPSHPERPEVWFQDLGCAWHLVAHSFTDYFRLMVAHLGIPCWQYAFTQVGLDPITRQWLRYLCPERLAIDDARCCYRSASVAVGGATTMAARTRAAELPSRDAAHRGAGEVCASQTEVSASAAGDRHYSFDLSGIDELLKGATNVRSGSSQVRRRQPTAAARQSSRYTEDSTSRPSSAPAHRFNAVPGPGSQKPSRLSSEQRVKQRRDARRRG